MGTADLTKLKSGTGPAAQTKTETLAEVAYRRLREDIVHNVFEPGMPLHLELLKQRYGLSFSPLREALNRLQTERLVVTATLRGFSVAPVSVEEMWDATETRILIECEALKRSINNGDDDWEVAVISTFHALDLQVCRMEQRTDEPESESVTALERRHKDFHRALIAACRSRRLISLADQLYTETERYRLPSLAGKNPATSRDIPQEHREIMETALARRSDEAAHLLAAHFRRTAELIEATML